MNVMAAGNPRSSVPLSSVPQQSPDIEWERIDKGRFFLVGTGVFTGITTCLFPLSVIKTRMMTLDAQGGGGNVGIRATAKAVRSVVSKEGVLGLYRGFPTVVTGFLPARLVYLSTLESVKSRMKKVLFANTQLDQTKVVAFSSFLSGACASLASQTIFVPVDVISQQQMVSRNRIGLGEKVRFGEGQTTNRSRGTFLTRLTFFLCLFFCLSLSPSPSLSLGNTRYGPSSETRGSGGFTGDTGCQSACLCRGVQYGGGPTASTRSSTGSCSAERGNKRATLSGKVAKETKVARLLGGGD